MNELKSAGASWLRASIAAVAALYAFAAGLLGPAAKFLNPKDSSYGLGKK
jgi:hypothetical protein